MVEAITRIDRLEQGLAHLAEAQARTEATLDRLVEAQRQLAEAQARTEATLSRLVEAQGRTEEQLAMLLSWWRGEDGRCQGECYERDVLRQAPVLFHDGDGGPADEPSVRRRSPCVGSGIQARPAAQANCIR